MWRARNIAAVSPGSKNHVAISDAPLNHDCDAFELSIEYPACLAARGRHGDIGAVVRFVEGAFPNQLLEQPLTCRHLYLPQPTCLRDGQSQPGHLAVFTANTCDKRIKRRHSAPIRRLGVGLRSATDAGSP